MSEVFYYNATNELQKLELYNIESSDFIRRAKSSGFKLLCVVEHGKISSTSLEFKMIEEQIANLLSGIRC